MEEGVTIRAREYSSLLCLMTYREAKECQLIDASNIIAVPTTVPASINYIDKRTLQYLDKSFTSTPVNPSSAQIEPGQSVASRNKELDFITRNGEYVKS